MQSITCPECNLTDWSEAVVCKRCGYAFQEVAEGPPKEEQQYQENFSELKEPESHDDSYEDSYEEAVYEEGFDKSGHDEEYFPDYSETAPQPRLNTRMAITSLILSIVANPYIASFWGTIVVMFLLIAAGMTVAIIGAVLIILLMPLGLILGIVAVVKSKRYPNEYGGKGLAAAGILASTAGILLLALTLGTVVPGLYSGYMTIVEGQAVDVVNKVIAAQKTYRAKTGGNCASLQELASSRVVDAEVGAGQKGEYRFILAMLPTVDGGCEIFAVPKKSSYARRSFFYSTEDDILRAADKNGELAAKADPPIDPAEYLERFKKLAKK